MQVNTFLGDYQYLPCNSNFTGLTINDSSQSAAHSMNSCIFPIASTIKYFPKILPILFFGERVFTDPMGCHIPDNASLLCLFRPLKWELILTQQDSLLEHVRRSAEPFQRSISKRQCKEVECSRKDWCILVPDRNTEPSVFDIS